MSRNKISRRRTREAEAVGRYVEKHRGLGPKPRQPETGLPVEARGSDGHCVFKLGDDRFGWDRRRSFTSFGYVTSIDMAGSVRCDGYDGECALLELRKTGRIGGQYVQPEGLNVRPCQPIRVKLIEEADRKIAETERKKNEIKTEENIKERQRIKRLYSWD